MGYKAVYPEEAINGHRAFIARRRATAPQRGIPHPHRRGMGRIPRPFRTPPSSPSATAAAHTEPAASTNTAASAAHCFGPTPPSGPVSIDIRDNLITRIAEAEQEGWIGEAEGLKVSLAAAKQKLAQLDNSVPTRHDPPRHPGYRDVTGRTVTTPDKGPS